MQNLSPFDRPLNIGEIIDRSFRIYRNKIGTLLFTAAIILLPIGILNVILNGSSLLTSLRQLGGPFSDFSIDGNILNVHPFLVTTLAIVTTLTSYVAMLAITHQGIGLLHGENPSTDQSLKKGISRLLGYIGMTILQGLLIIPVAIAGAILFMLTSSMRSEIAIVISAVLLVVAVLYFLARWSMAVPALIDQDLGPAEALGYSWNITRNYAWRTVIFTLLMSLLSLVIFALPASLLLVISWLFVDTPRIFVTIVASIEQFFNVLWLPLQLVASIIYYFDLRVREEGYHITKRVERVEAEVKLASMPNAYS